MQSQFIDIQNTVAFLKEFLAIDNANILEIGCGNGRLAAGLMEAGYQVLGIDLDPGKVERARQRGVRAEVQDITEFETDEKFDVALFSRSLHHISNLDKAMTRVKALLGEKGRIVVEDFDIDQVDEKTADWFYELRDVVALFLGKAVSNELKGVERWKKEHHHEPPLHSKSAMIRALESKFGNVHKSTVPYLYRYFVDDCEHSAQGSEALARVYELENQRLGKNLIQPVGIRIIAKKYFSYLK